MSIQGVAQISIDSVYTIIDSVNMVDALPGNMAADYEIYSSIIEKTANKYERKIDSLKFLDYPTTPTPKKLDSLNSVTSFDVWRKEQNTLVNRPQDKQTRLESSAEGNVNDKLGILSKESGGKR